MLEEIALPIHLDNNAIAHISASIGISIFPEDSEEPKQLLQYADQAMYKAKNQGKSQYYFYHAAHQK